MKNLSGEQKLVIFGGIFLLVLFLILGIVSNKAGASSSIKAWQYDRQTPAVNYYVPADEVGYTEWNSDNDIYSISYEYEVSGISSGNGK